MFLRKIEPPWLIAHPLIWFVFIAVIVLFAYGVDVDRFLTYNLFYSEIVSNPSKYRDTPLSLISDNWSLLVFHKGLSVALVNPEINACIAVCLFAATMWIGFLALKTQSTREHAFLIIVLVGIVAYGYFPGLDSSSLVFDRKALVAFLIVSAIYLLTKELLVLFFIVAGVGAMLHPLDMLAGLAFVMPGYALFLFFEKRQLFFRFLVGLCLFVFFTALLRSVVTGMEDTAGYSVANWYELALLLEVGDVALFDFIRKSIGVNGSVIALSMLIVVQNRKRLQLIDYWCLTFGPITLLMIVLEGLHGLGIIFGIFSELFISLQCRRGFWIVSIVALAQLFLYVFGRFAKEDRETHVDLAVVICAVLLHSVAVIFIALLFFSLKRRKAFGDRDYLVFATSAVLLGLQLLNPESQIHISGEIQKVLVFAGFTVFLVLSFKHFLRSSILITVVLFSGVVLANNNIRQEIFRDSWVRVTQGVAGTNDQILSIVTSNASESLREHLEVITMLNKQGHGRDEGVLFSSRILGYAGPIVSNQRFIFSRWDNTLMVHRVLAASYIEKLRNFGIDWSECRIKKKEGTACFLDRIQSRIEELSEEEVSQLAQAYGFRFVVRTMPMRIPPVYKSSSFKVYDVSHLEN